MQLLHLLVEQVVLLLHLLRRELALAQHLLQLGHLLLRGGHLQLLLLDLAAAGLQLRPELLLA